MNIIKEYTFALNKQLLGFVRDFIIKNKDIWKGKNIFNLIPMDGLIERTQKK